MRRFHIPAFRLVLSVASSASFRVNSDSPSTVPRSDSIEFVVQKVFSTMRTHLVTTDPRLKKRLSLQAWRDLQVLSDADLEQLDTASIGKLLHVWAHFAKFWELGRDGPSDPLPDGSGADPEEIPIELSAAPLGVAERPIQKSQRISEYKVMNKTVERARRSILEETFE
jgi:hypothetical protein